MKIGIITTQYAPNYGALLQAFSLQTFLKEELPNSTVEIIDYYPDGTEKYWNVLNLGKGLKNNILKGYLLIHPKFIREKAKLLKRMNQFREERLIRTEKCDSETDLEVLGYRYDVLICGSDQIWNTSRPEFSLVNFLDFSYKKEKIRRIAYAPSVVSNFVVEYESQIKKCLGQFEAISVRESNDISKIKRLCDCEVIHVCDPIFLTDVKKWNSIIPARLINEPYILSYFISVGDFSPKIVEKVRKDTGLKVVYVNVNVRDKFNSDFDIRSASPLEFVSYIRDAEYVVTNSFHCAAFSVLFKKKTVVVANIANSRLTSLMSKANLEECLIDENNYNMQDYNKMNIDYSKCNLENWIIESKHFLLSSLVNSEECDV